VLAGCLYNRCHPKHTRVDARRMPLPVIVPAVFPFVNHVAETNNAEYNATSLSIYLISQPLFVSPECSFSYVTNRLFKTNIQ
jgi:hypothetical protein